MGFMLSISASDSFGSDRKVIYLNVGKVESLFRFYSFPLLVDVVPFLAFLVVLLSNSFLP